MPTTRIDGAACADATAAVDASRAAATESAAAVAYAHLDTPAIVRRKLAASRHRLDEVMRHLIITASRYGIDPAVAEEFAVAATSTLHGKGWIRIDRSIAEERDDLTVAVRTVRDTLLVREGLALDLDTATERARAIVQVLYADGRLR